MLLKKKDWFIKLLTAHIQNRFVINDRRSIECFLVKVFPVNYSRAEVSMVKLIFFISGFVSVNGVGRFYLFLFLKRAIPYNAKTSNFQIWSYLPSILDFPQSTQHLTCQPSTGLSHKIKSALACCRLVHPQYLCIKFKYALLSNFRSCHRFIAASFA